MANMHRGKNYVPTLERGNDKILTFQITQAQITNQPCAKPWRVLALAKMDQCHE